MIPLPSKPKIISEDKNKAVFEIAGLYPGYGQTIGNGLRRVMLSSLTGAAATSIKVEGVGHEFSTIEGVMEDVTDIILNIKQLRFRLHQEGPFTVNLSVEGEREVTGKDLVTPSQVDLVTPDVHIATLTSKKSRLVLEAVVESGRGYIPVEARTKEKVEAGNIALDAAFSPVRHINYEVENMRLGDRTDYNLVRFHIETDGSLTPREAFSEASKILVRQFEALGEGFLEEKTAVVEDEGWKATTDLGEKEIKADETLKIKLGDLKLSARTLNVLREGGIKTVGGLVRKKEPSLRELAGMGDKGIQEIKKAMGNLGITLRQ